MTPEAGKPKTRWAQFSLRTLTLFVLVAGPVAYGSFYWGPIMIEQLFAPKEPQTLPSPYYLKDDVQYFSSVDEFEKQTGNVSDPIEIAQRFGNL